ncbi:MAG TPA: hypothetical protein VGG02_01070 [Chthoniobacterales bacterium]|jgi:hypothetical protein
MKTLPGRSRIIPSSRWAAYASAGLATAFGSAEAVQAEIHYSGPVRAVLDAGSHETSERSFALEGGAHLRFQFARFRDGRGTAFVQSESFRGSQPGTYSYPRFASKLSAGALISDGNFVGGPDKFATIADSHGHGLWKGRDHGYIGFRFNTGGGFQYGWVRVRKMADNSFIVMDYAWGDPGDAVTAGERQSSLALSGEGSLGWLATGAAGLTSWREARSAGRGN